MNVEGTDCAGLSARGVSGLIEAICSAISRNAAHLDELDTAIGDGDHGTNMERGAQIILDDRTLLAGMALGDAITAAGHHLVMSVGGASGPLYGTLLLVLGDDLPNDPSPAEFAIALSGAVEAVARRGRSERGWKTMLDVLYPLSEAVIEGASTVEISRNAAIWAEATRNLRALRGRASFLGERSVGHIDPGAASAALMIQAVCAALSDTSP